MKIVIASVICIFLSVTLFADSTNVISVDQIQERYGLTKIEDDITGTVTLTGGQKNLVLALGMKTVLIDGKSYTLKGMPTFSDGKIMVPEELEGLLEGNYSPLVKPTARMARKFDYKFKVVIDPGHGGVHSENRSRDGIYEKDVNLDVALKLAKILQSHGVNVSMTRTTDRELARDVREDLGRRVAFSNRENPDLFISIHSNHATTSFTRGFEVFVARGYNHYTNDSLALAQCVRKEFANNLNTPDRGIKDRDFYVIKWSRAPAVLVELDFLSNSASAKELRSQNYREKLAELLGEGISNFLNTRKNVANAIYTR